MIECENMTPTGCDRMDFAKNLLCDLIIESPNDNWIDFICNKQCCIDCEYYEKCPVHCNHVDVIKNNIKGEDND